MKRGDIVQPSILKAGDTLNFPYGSVTGGAL